MADPKGSDSVGRKRVLERFDHGSIVCRVVGLFLEMYRYQAAGASCASAFGIGSRWSWRCSWRTSRVFAVYGRCAQAASSFPVGQGDFGEFSVLFASTVAERYTRRGDPRLSVRGVPLLVLTRGP